MSQCKNIFSQMVRASHLPSIKLIAKSCPHALSKLIPLHFFYPDLVSHWRFSRTNGVSRYYKCSYPLVPFTLKQTLGGITIFG